MTTPTHECHHIIRHARTPEERDIVVRRLDDARVTGDMNEMSLCLAMLGKCNPPAEKGKI